MSDEEKIPPEHTEADENETTIRRAPRKVTKRDKEYQEFIEELSDTYLCSNKLVGELIGKYVAWCETHDWVWEKEAEPIIMPGAKGPVGPDNSGLANDPGNHPKHYNSHPSGIECIQVAEHMSFNLGNAIKYLWRFQNKHGAKDLEKAVWYIERELQRLYPIKWSNEANPVFLTGLQKAAAVAGNEAKRREADLADDIE